MSVQSAVQEKTLDMAASFLVNAGPALAKNEALRKALVGRAKDHILGGLKEARTPGFKYPPGVADDRTAAGLALASTVERAFAQNLLSKNSLRALVDIVVKKLLVQQGERSACDAFREKYGTNPPGLLVIAPGKTCNLHCVGCYADAGPTAERLDFDVLDQIVTQAKTLWGARFIVLTGGEPLAYRSQGKTVVDLAAKHPDVFFMMYTNGTLIDEKMAERLGEVGNLSPAISLEGWKEKTDARRGPGVFDKAMAAMDRLRAHGVMFGISLTATHENCEEILSDEFVDTMFMTKGALYGWLFQYMPIGRKFTLDLMVTPEQRIWMWRRTWDLMRDKGYFMPDFWNDSTLCEGCISAGRDDGGGYLYIEWNGNVTPCVFVPYTPTNVKHVFETGGNLNDVWADPFFADIRAWQTSYKQKNILMPCPNRDHHADLRALIAKDEPEPLDENARDALLDPGYARGLAEYEERFQRYADPIWQKYYVRPVNPEETGIADLPDLPDLPHGHEAGEEAGASPER
jgi:MoaA/NifB/PqqE/SkfB family radical SAM enzyme